MWYKWMNNAQSSIMLKVRRTRLQSVSNDIENLPGLTALHYSNRIFAPLQDSTDPTYFPAIQRFFSQFHHWSSLNCFSQPPVLWSLFSNPPALRYPWLGLNRREDEKIRQISYKILILDWKPRLLTLLISTNIISKLPWLKGISSFRSLKPCAKLAQNSRKTKTVTNRKNGGNVKTGECLVCASFRFAGGLRKFCAWF